MKIVFCVVKGTDHGPPIVNAEDLGYKRHRRCRRVVDDGEPTFVHEKPVKTAVGVFKGPDDVVEIVDGNDFCKYVSRDVDVGERAVLQEEPMEPSTIRVIADDR